MLSNRVENRKPYRRKRLGAEKDVRFTPVSLFLLAIVGVAVSFVVPSLSVLVAAFVVAWGVWFPRVEFLPAIIVAQISSVNFFAGGGVVLPPVISVGGLPINVVYATEMAIATRVSISYFVEKNDRLRSIRLLYYLWLSALPLAFAMGVMGRLEGNGSWMLPFRMVLMCGAFFYGALVLADARRVALVLVYWLCPLVLFFVSLASIGVFWHRMLFIFASLGVPLGFFVFRYCSGWRKGMGAACVLQTAFYGFGFGVPGLQSFDVGGQEAGGGVGGMFGGSGTLTLNFLVIVSFVMSVIYFYRFGRLNVIIGRLVGVPGFVALMCLSVFIAIVSPKYAMREVQAGALGEATVSEKIVYKLFDDRSVIWHATLDDILSEPFVLRPGGRAMYFMLTPGNEVEWFHGAHNIFLEAMKTLRWWCGPVLLTVLAYALVCSGRVLRQPFIGAGGVFAISVAATGLVGGFTGHYPITDEVSFFVFAFGAISWFSHCDGGVRL